MTMRDTLQIPADPYLTEQLVMIELERQKVLAELTKQREATEQKLAWLRALEDRLRLRQTKNC